MPVEKLLFALAGQAVSEATPVHAHVKRCSGQLSEPLVYYATGGGLELGRGFESETVGDR